MISMSLDGEKQVRAAVEQFVDEAKTESSDWLKNMGYAISGTAGSRTRQQTNNRLHMYPSVRHIGDDVRLQIRFKKANAGARKIARRALSDASRHIWSRWTGGLR